MGVPQQRQIVVLVEGGDGLDFSTQDLDATFQIQNLPNPASKIAIAAIVLGLVQNLIENANQRLFHCLMLLLECP